MFFNLIFAVFCALQLTAAIGKNNISSLMLIAFMMKFLMEILHFTDVRYDGFPDGNPQQWGYVGLYCPFYIFRLTDNEIFSIRL